MTKRVFDQIAEGLEEALEVAKQPQWAMEKAEASLSPAWKHSAGPARQVQIAGIARALVEQDRIAEARGIERAAEVAYQNPHYVMSISYNDGALLPGSPYDQGRYDAMNDIRKLKEA